jgi:hypothetical protein
MYWQLGWGGTSGASLLVLVTSRRITTGGNRRYRSSFGM